MCGFCPHTQAGQPIASRLHYTSCLYTDNAGGRSNTQAGMVCATQRQANASSICQGMHLRYHLRWVLGSWLLRSACPGVCNHFLVHSWLSSLAQLTCSCRLCCSTGTGPVVGAGVAALGGAVKQAAGATHVPAAQQGRYGDITFYNMRMLLSSGAMAWKAEGGGLLSMLRHSMSCQSLLRVPVSRVAAVGVVLVAVAVAGVAVACLRVGSCSSGCKHRGASIQKRPPEQAIAKKRTKIERLLPPDEHMQCNPACACTQPSPDA